MVRSNSSAKINVKVLVTLLVVVAAIGVSLFAARHARRRLLSRMDLSAGQAAYEKGDWSTAYRHFRGYLNRNPDDLEILKKYAEARLSIRPLDWRNVMGAIPAYRRVIRLDPQDEIAYEELARLYAATGNFEELLYIAQARLDLIPDERKGRLDLVENDRRAHLWLAEALVSLRKADQARLKLEPFITKLAELRDKSDEHVYDEYVQACALMSEIEIEDDSREAPANTLKWLNDAVDYAPESVEALVHRASFYRTRSEVPAIEEDVKEKILEDARKDLTKADGLVTENPRLRLSLCREWIAHGNLDQAAAELRAVRKLTQEELEEHFLDTNTWIVERFLLAGELARQKGATAEGAYLADEVLTVLKERRHRIRVLPFSVELYVGAGRVEEARKCLDEYLDTTYAQGGAGVDEMTLAYLQALVARAEEKPYIVIDVLQPATVSDAAPPEIWGLLAEAYSRTDQTRRAVSALTQYILLSPRDPAMKLQLAREYLKLRDWNRAFETARLTEPLDPANIGIKLLRLEANVYLASERDFTIDKARLNTSLAELRDMRRDHPKRVDIRILQAMMAAYLEKPEDAERELKAAIKECDEPLRAEMQLAEHYYRTNRMSEAISVCRTACKSHAEVAEPWLSLSGLYVSRADYDLARRCLREGLNTVEGRHEKRHLLLRLARVELLYGNRAEGIRILSELAAQNKQEVRARSLLLSLPEIQQDRDPNAPTAKELIEELKNAEGQSGLMWRLHEAALWLASSDWRSKQASITDHLQRCIESDPEWSQPVLLLIDMHEKLGDFKRFEDTCRKALARNPSAADVLIQLVNLLERQGRSSDAEKVIQQFEDKVDPRVTREMRLGIALNARDFSGAISELELRVANDDRDADSRILLARLIYLQDQDLDRALELLDEAEAIAGGSMALTAARVSILREEGRLDEVEQSLDDSVANREDFDSYMIRAAYLENEARLEGDEGKLERAEQDYRKLTTFPERGAMGYELLSNFYGRNGKIDKAAETLQEGVSAYPENVNLKRQWMKTLLLRNGTADKPRAIEILTTLEEQLPQDPELMRIRAALVLEERTPESLERARALLANAVKLDPMAIDGHLMLIGVAMEQKEYEAARDLANQAIGSNRDNQDNPDLLSARGRAELALDNVRRAAVSAQMALRKDPNNVAARDVLVAAAVRLTDSSLDKTAAQLIRQTLEDDPDNAWGRNAIVALALKRADRAFLEEARALIESALGNNPTDEQMLLSRARILISLGLPQTAIPELATHCQTEAGGNSVDAVLMLATLYRLSGEMDLAERWVEQAEKKDPTHQTVVHARVLLLIAQERFDDLAQISSAYVSAPEQDPTTVMVAASVLAAQDSIELKKEGAKLFEHAGTLLSEPIHARLSLASTLYQIGNVEQAKEIYQESLEQNPYNARILNDLAWILQEHDKSYDAALELANKALSIHSDDVSRRNLLDTRGTILLKLERLGEARKDFEGLLLLLPDDSPQRARTLLQLSRICTQLNDRTKAREYLNEASDIDRKIDVFTDEERSEIKTILQTSDD